MARTPHDFGPLRMAEIPEVARIPEFIDQRSENLVEGSKPRDLSPDHAAVPRGDSGTTLVRWLVKSSLLFERGSEARLRFYRKELFVVE